MKVKKAKNGWMLMVKKNLWRTWMSMMKTLMVNMLIDVDPSCCFMCDQKHKTIESCMVHRYKQHGFFIHDVEYLSDPTGLLTSPGLRVKRDFMCLYCNERCHAFNSL